MRMPSLDVAPTSSATFLADRKITQPLLNICRFFKIQAWFLSTHADRQGVNIYRLLFVILFLMVCTVTDFSTDNKASCVKFCTVVHRHPGQRISHLGERCFPRSPKSVSESACARNALYIEPLDMRRSWNIGLRVDVGVWIDVSPH